MAAACDVIGLVSCVTLGMVSRGFPPSKIMSVVARLPTVLPQNDERGRCPVLVSLRASVMRDVPFF